MAPQAYGFKHTVYCVQIKVIYLFIFVNLPYREEYLSMVEHTADGRVDADLIFRALTMVRRSKNLLHL